MQELLGQMLTIFLNFCDFLMTMLFLVSHLEASTYPHDWLANRQQILVARPILQQCVICYIQNFRCFKRFIHAHRSQTDIVKYCKNSPPLCSGLFLWSMVLYQFGCVCLSQRDSTLNAAHCTFTSNNASSAGAIYAEVGPDIQGLTTLQNRTQQSNETVVY